MADEPILDLAPRQIVMTKPRDLIGMGRLYGVGGVKQALDEAKCTLPGFALAVALVDKLIAEERAEMSRRYFRIAQKNGVDLNRVVTMTIEGVNTLEITFGEGEAE